MPSIGSLYATLGLDTKPFEKNLRDLGPRAKKESQRVGRSLTWVNAGLNAAGIGLLGAAGAAGGALTFVGTQAVKVSNQMKEGAITMAADLGITRDSAMDLALVARNVWENNWGEQVSSVIPAVSAVHRVLGFVGNQAQNATESLMTLDDAFHVDYQDALQAVGVLMAMGAESGEAFDFLTRGFQSGLDSSGDFLESITEYAPQFKQMGFTVDGMWNLFQQGAASGVLGLDKISDATKEFRLRFTEQTKDVTAANEVLGLNTVWEAFRQGSITGSTAMQHVIDAIGGVDDAWQRHTLGIAYFGTQWEDLGEEIVLGVDVMKDSTSQWMGGVDLLKERYDTLSASLETIRRKAVIAFTPLVDKVKERIMEALDPVQTYIDENLSDVILKFTDETLPTIETKAKEIATAMTEGVKTVWNEFIAWMLPGGEGYKMLETAFFTQEGELRSWVLPALALLFLTPGGIEYPILALFGPQIISEMDKNLPAFQEGFTGVIAEAWKNAVEIWDMEAPLRERILLMIQNFAQMFADIEWSSLLDVVEYTGDKVWKDILWLSETDATTLAVQGVGTFIAKVNETITGLEGRLNTAFTNIYNYLFNTDDFKAKIKQDIEENIASEDVTKALSAVGPFKLPTIQIGDVSAANAVLPFLQFTRDNIIIDKDAFQDLETYWTSFISRFTVRVNALKTSLDAIKLDDLKTKIEDLKETVQNVDWSLGLPDAIKSLMDTAYAEAKTLLDDLKTQIQTNEFTTLIIADVQNGWEAFRVASTVKIQAWLDDLKLKVQLAYQKLDLKSFAIAAFEEGKAWLDDMEERIRMHDFTQTLIANLEQAWYEFRILSRVRMERWLKHLELTLRLRFMRIDAKIRAEWDKFEQYMKDSWDRIQAYFDEKVTQFMDQFDPLRQAKTKLDVFWKNWQGRFKIELNKFQETMRVRVLIAIAKLRVQIRLAWGSLWANFGTAFILQTMIRITHDLFRHQGIWKIAKGAIRTFFTSMRTWIKVYIPLMWKGIDLQAIPKAAMAQKSMWQWLAPRKFITASERATLLLNMKTLGTDAADRFKGNFKKSWSVFWKTSGNELALSARSLGYRYGEQFWRGLLKFGLTSLKWTNWLGWALTALDLYRGMKNSGVWDTFWNETIHEWIAILDKHVPWLTNAFRAIFGRVGKEFTALMAGDFGAGFARHGYDPLGWDGYSLDLNDTMEALGQADENLHAWQENLGHSWQFYLGVFIGQVHKWAIIIVTALDTVLAATVEFSDWFFTKLWNEWWPAFKKFREEFMEGWHWVKNNLWPLFQQHGFWGGLLQSMQILGGMAGQNFWNSMISTLTAHTPFAGNLLQAFGNLIANQIGIFRGFLAQQYMRGGNWQGALNQYINHIRTQMFNWFGRLFQGLGAWIMAQLQTLWTNIQTWVTNLSWWSGFMNVLGFGGSAATRWYQSSGLSLIINWMRFGWPQAWQMFANQWRTNWNDFINWLNNTAGPWLRQALVNIMNWAVAAMQNAWATTLSQLQATTWWQPFMNILNSIGNFFQGWWNSFGTAFVVNWFRLGPTGAVNVLMNQWQQNVQIIWLNVIQPALTWLGNAFQTWWTNAQSIGWINQWLTGWNILMQWRQNWRQHVNTLIGNVWQAIQDAWNNIIVPGVIGLIPPFFQPLVAGAGTGPTAGLGWRAGVNLMVQQIWDAIKDAWNNIIVPGVQGLIPSLLGQFSQNLPQANPTMVGATGPASLMGTYGLLVKALLSQPFKDAIKAIEDELKKIGDHLVTAVDTVKTKLTDMKTAVTDKFNEITQWLEDQKDLIKDKMTDMFERAKRAILVPLAGIVITVKGFGDTIKGIDWLQLGKDIIMGIVDGIKKNALKVKDALTDALDTAKTNTMEWLGIQSPSRVFAMEVGKPLAEGLIYGFRHELDSSLIGRDFLDRFEDRREGWPRGGAQVNFHITINAPSGSATDIAEAFRPVARESFETWQRSVGAL